MAAGDGLVTMTPTSIVVAGAGSSGSIQADGSVNFATATSVSLNGVFTSSHDNYLVVLSSINNNNNVVARLRTAGTDASGTDYTRQYLLASSTTVSGARATSQTYAFIGVGDPTNFGGDHAHIYGPALAQPTAFRNVNVHGDSGGRLVDNACTHSLSTSYDGLTILPEAGSFAGTVVVFGYEE